LPQKAAGYCLPVLSELSVHTYGIVTAVVLGGLAMMPSATAGAPAAQLQEAKSPLNQWMQETWFLAFSGGCLACLRRRAAGGSLCQCRLAYAFLGLMFPMISVCGFATTCTAAYRSDASSIYVNEHDTCQSNR
jgi:hypothetical protein